MWYIYLRDYSDTELLSSPKYNDKIKELINKITYMQVEFAFQTDGFINVRNRPVTTIQEFLNDREFWYDEDDEQFKCIRELKKEIG